MTAEDLHSIPDFASLQSDQRFIGLMLHLKKHPPELLGAEPHSMIQDSGKAAEYHRITRLIESAFLPPAPKTDRQSGFAPYSNIPLQRQ